MNDQLDVGGERVAGEVRDAAGAALDRRGVGRAVLQRGLRRQRRRRSSSSRSVTLAGTTLPPESFSWKFEAVIVLAHQAR